MEADYYQQDDPRERPQLHSFGIFRQHIAALDHRNKKLSLNRLSLHADILKERTAGTAISFENLMQADFVLFLIDSINSLKYEKSQEWWPETLVYKTLYNIPFEIFIKSESKRYFDKIKGLLGVNSKEDFIPIIDAFKSKKLRAPVWQFDEISPELLMNFNRLCIKD